MSEYHNCARTRARAYYTSICARARGNRAAGATMRRRHHAAPMLAASLLVVLASPQPATAPTIDSSVTASAPSVLLMLADDLGHSDVGFNGNANVATSDPQLKTETPTLDALARNGTVLRWHYSCHVVCVHKHNLCVKDVRHVG